MKRYSIDISDPKCWNEIVIEHKKSILSIVELIRPLYSKYLLLFKGSLFTYKLTGGIVLFEQEIYEIAKILEISFAECLLFQITYELCSACTSAILQSDNKYVHVRTMDWEIDQLRDITASFRVYNKDKYLFDSIGFVGCVGVFTGFKKDIYTISLNYRRTANPSIWSNIKALFKGYT
jgi:hypothetical protein